MQTNKIVADRQDTFRQLKTVKATADGCKSLQTCLFLYFQWDGAGLTVLNSGTKTKVFISGKDHGENGTKQKNPAYRGH